MYFPCQDCQANEGSCSKHPRVKCSDCGLTYVDDEDWSGPAHSQQACMSRMRSQLYWLKRVASNAKVAVQLELDRGYVLTHEPNAGELWRKRWNELLGELEDALAREDKK